MAVLTAPNYPRSLFLGRTTVRPQPAYLEAIMFQFTSYGSPVDAVESYAEATWSPTDVRHLPLWIAAARAADDADHCGEYDAIAINVGGPTRDDLRNAGLLDSEFTVTGTRTVTVTFTVPFEATYTAARPGDVRREFSTDELGDFDMYAIRNAAYNEYSVDDDDIEIDSVERN